jgi:hypothetical protein
MIHAENERYRAAMLRGAAYALTNTSICLEL